MKIFGKILGFLFAPLAIGLYITFSWAWFALQFYVQISDNLPNDYVYEQFNIFHERTIDLRLLARGEKPRQDYRKPKVAILAVDDASLKEIGQWPWSREVIGQVIEKLFSYDPKVLAFDIVWAEPDPKSAIPALLDLKNFAEDNSILPPLLAKKINQEMIDLNTDEQFAQVVAKYSDRLVMGAYYNEQFRGLQLGEPFQDLCFQELFKLQDAFYYFDREDPLVYSSYDEEVFLPFQWADILVGHFATLELSSIRDWLKANSENEQKLKSLIALLQRYGIKLDFKGYVALVQFVVNDRIEDLKPKLIELNPMLAQSENLMRLVHAIQKIVDRNVIIKLKGQIYSTQEEYCRRFLEPNDEILPKYKAVYPEMEKEYKEFSNLSFEDGLAKFKRSNLDTMVPQTYGWTYNIKSVAQGTKHTGFFNAVQDSDGSIRKGRLFIKSGERLVPSLAFASFLIGNKYVAEVPLKGDDFSERSTFTYVSDLKILKDPQYQDFPTEGEESSDDPHTEDVVTHVPVDSKGHLVINYSGGDRQFPYLEVSELLNDSTQARVAVRLYDDVKGTWGVTEKMVDKAEFIKDTYFIMGATAVGIYDLRVTPFNENFPGVETHANVLDNLLRNDFLVKDLATEQINMPILLVVLGVILSIIIAQFGALTGALATIMSLVGIFYYESQFLFAEGLVTVILFPVLLVLMLYIFLTGFKYFTEEAQKRELKGTFQKYVSPSIVNEVLKDPTNLQLGGRKQVMTVFFSDIRGFTTISEKLDPQALSDLLNSYLTPMTEIVFKNKGTLDKYMGDAVMAFFGAPIPFEDHALMACRCALEQLEELGRLQEQYEKQGLPAIDIGIGVNTGEMSVGNMGSQTVRSYTVMGDAVNLGSRLEGINKQYGTRIIISEFTYEQVKDKVIAREIDWVRVKGKALPVRIFELVSEKEPQSDVMFMLDNFKQGFIKYHEKAFDAALGCFSEALNHRPDDTVSKLYIDRCQRYIEAPPPEDWDGVFIMTTK